MRRDRAHRIGGQVVFGLFVMLLGVVFTLRNFGIVSQDIFSWWPLLLVALGVLRLARTDRRGSTWGVILIVVGSALTLQKLGIVQESIWAWWPLLLVLAGGNILLNGYRHRRMLADPSRPAGGSDAVVSGTAVMSGWERRCASQEFRGGDLTAVMGGIELDLRGARLAGQEAMLNVTAFWGGIEIRVPQGWTIDNRVTPFLGGVEDSTFPPQGTAAPTLVLRGSVVMGGVEVSN